MNGDLAIQVDPRGMVGAGRTGLVRAGAGVVVGARVQLITLEGNLLLTIGVEADLECHHKYARILLVEDVGEGVVVIFFTKMLNCMTIGVL